jgi:hypothetical protein
MTRDDIERLTSDRAGTPKNRDALHRDVTRRPVTLSLSKGESA